MSLLNYYVTYKNGVPAGSLELKLFVAKTEGRTITEQKTKYHHVVDGRGYERWVLADWYRTGSYLVCDATGCRNVDL